MAPQHPLRIVIFGNEFQPNKSASILRILQILKERQAEVLIDKPYFDFLNNCYGKEVWCDAVFEGNRFSADYALSIGGDGTFLKSAARIVDKNIPILGVNMGRLGFLADVLPCEVSSALNALFDGKVNIEQHTGIEIDTGIHPISGNHFALNDIALLKRDTASMITIRCNINGKYLVTYEADGLIVSTPTGSTAYSLSNGGPIIVPSAGILCLTPVAPHSLNMRPVVINDDSVLELHVESRSHNFLAAIDGRSETLPEGTTVTIRKAGKKINIVKQQQTHYFSTLREKLMWGADNRQNLT